MNQKLPLDPKKRSVGIFFVVLFWLNLISQNTYVKVRVAFQKKMV